MGYPNLPQPVATKVGFEGIRFINQVAQAHSCPERPQAVLIALMVGAQTVPYMPYSRKVSTVPAVIAFEEAVTGSTFVVSVKRTPAFFQQPEFGPSLGRHSTIHTQLDVTLSSPNSLAVTPLLCVLSPSVLLRGDRTQNSSGYHKHRW